MTQKIKQLKPNKIEKNTLSWMAVYNAEHFTYHDEIEDAVSDLIRQYRRERHEKTPNFKTEFKKFRGKKYLIIWLYQQYW